MISNYTSPLLYVHLIVGICNYEKTIFFFFSRINATLQWTVLLITVCISVVFLVWNCHFDSVEYNDKHLMCAIWLIGVYFICTCPFVMYVDCNEANYFQIQTFIDKGLLLKCGSH